ncbi:uncharacterized protein LOC115240870 isoform X2 [Formica exsecta]|uniref:uncharacterized protein LOC115240870 isoform X2 n=1 Tax=Formica exsecta TaxID=72781 RepID=UPI00114425BC|nr:uncharacterized protein LOC115240870 isoform X2 [Formica exsecta]
MEIQTFIFFDLETTGLIQGKIMPRITEIALVAVTRESICNCNKASLPRVLHKLILPINPQKIIPPTVAYMTTHNGNRFDYPIFLNELERINKVFDDKILCIDTWKMFQDFFKKKDLERKTVQDLLDDEYNDSLSMLDIDMVMMEQKTKIDAMPISQATPPYNGYIKVINDKKYDTNKEYNNDIDVESPEDFRQKANEKTPENQVMRQHEIVLVERPFKKNNPRKKLDFGCERPVSLKLGAIYEYMFDSNFPHEHSAEADCLAMIRCITNIVDFFLEWSDNNATPLVCCKRI